MARELRKAGAAILNGTAKVIETFANTYKANSKIEVAENLTESSVEGSTATEKAKNVKDIYDSLID